MHPSDLTFFGDFYPVISVKHLFFWFLGRGNVAQQETYL